MTPTTTTSKRLVASKKSLHGLKTGDEKCRSKVLDERKEQAERRESPWAQTEVPPPTGARGSE